MFIVYPGHEIIHRDAISCYLNVSFGVRYISSSLEENRENKKCAALPYHAFMPTEELTPTVGLVLRGTGTQPI